MRVYCPGALRLVRSMVALKDDAYLKQLIKSGLYGAVMHALVANGPKYNMLNSAVIDLFDYIRKVTVGWIAPPV
jgi:protein phosphatase-4 regulatory subunit 3